MNGGQIIREARRRAGLTQVELATRLGVPQSAVARWETGAVVPRSDALSRATRACGFDLVPRLVPTDEGEWSLVVENLERTPEERLAKLTDAVGFVEAGRRAVRAATDA